MFQGFYMATSGMLSRTRNLNVISNNMANVLTPGYKADEFMQSTFRQHLVARTGNKDKAHPQQLGSMDYIASSDETVTDYSNAGFRTTSSALDVAINGSGFFAIQSEGGTLYTRNGSFTLDNEGYLTLPSTGRVLGTNGPIRLGTDRVNIDSSGNIFREDDNTFIGRIAIYDFADYQTDLNKTDNNLFIASAPAQLTNSPLVQRALEDSNADMVEQMTKMMASQRALQSSASVLTSYDTLMGKIVSQLGPA